MRRWPVGLVMWLLVLAGAELACFAAICHFFVRTEHGQMLDLVALTGNTVGQSRVEGPVDTILNTMSALSLAIATAVVGFIALIRRRVALAVGAILLVGGANVTTQLLKQIIYRPELGVDMERAAAGNSLPSGHTTIAASVAVALILVLPARLRGVGGVLGALFAAVAGVATLSAGWHRPSDAIAALLIVGAWACAAGVFIVIAQHHHGGVEYGPANRFAVRALAVAGLVLLAGCGVAVMLTEQVLSTPPDELSRLRLLTAYAGGAMGIAGTAGLVLAFVLATVHRVVPQLVPPPVEEADREMAAVAG
ncbi:phosphatase PAP2 family protein [Planosporangium mesophilum]